MFSLVGVLPSPFSAAPVGFARALFEGFIGTTTPSDSSPPFVPVLRLLSSPAGLPLSLAANDEVSRFSCMQFLSVPGVYDYAGPATGSRLSARRGAAFPLCPRGRRPGCSSRSSIPCPLIPQVHASAPASQPAPQNARPGGSLLLSCRDLSSPTACRFIP